MRRTELLQGIRKMRFEEAYEGWNAGRLTQAAAAQVPGMCERSYTWVKKRLQEAKLFAKAEKRGAHRKRRERSPLPGTMIHQDGSAHEWVAGRMWDLIVTLDDATSEHYAMFFVEEEVTASSFRGVRDVVSGRLQAQRGGSVQFDFRLLPTAHEPSRRRGQPPTGGQPVRLLRGARPRP